MSSDSCSHWCYSCRQPVNLRRQNDVCPNCSGGFVQELEDITSSSVDNQTQRPRFMESVSNFLRRQISMQQQARPASPAVYPSYLHSQPNPTPETMPNSMPMQVPFSGVSQPVASRPESMPYGYDRSGRPLQQQPATPHLKPSFGAPGDGYAASGAHPTLSPGNAYVMYDGEGTRAHPPPQPNFQQSGYPPSSFPPQNQQPAPSPNLMVRPPQQVRNHPYNELIEKLVSMGYRGDHVVNVIQRLEESGQPVDFNAILDRMNGHSSGGPQRGW